MNATDYHDISFDDGLQVNQIQRGLRYYRYEPECGYLYSGYFLDEPGSGTQGQMLRVAEGRIRGNQRPELAITTLTIRGGEVFRSPDEVTATVVASPDYPIQAQAFTEWLNLRALNGDNHALMWDVLICPEEELYERLGEIEARAQEADGSKPNPWDGIEEDLL